MLPSFAGSGTSEPKPGQRIDKRQGSELLIESQPAAQGNSDSDVCEVPQASERGEGPSQRRKLNDSPEVASVLDDQAAPLNASASKAGPSRASLMEDCMEIGCINAVALTCGCSHPPSSLLSNVLLAVQACTTVSKSPLPSNDKGNDLRTSGVPSWLHHLSCPTCRCVLSYNDITDLCTSQQVSSLSDAISSAVACAATFDLLPPVQQPSPPAPPPPAPAHPRNQSRRGYPARRQRHSRSGDQEVFDLATTSAVPAAPPACEVEVMDLTLDDEEEDGKPTLTVQPAAQSEAQLMMFDLTDDANACGNILSPAHTHSDATRSQQVAMGRAHWDACCKLSGFLLTLRRVLLGLPLRQLPAGVAAASSDPVAGIDREPWACKRCTKQNPGTVSKCVVCHAHQPPASPAPDPLAAAGAAAAAAAAAAQPGTSGANHSPWEWQEPGAVGKPGLAGSSLARAARSRRGAPSAAPLPPTSQPPSQAPAPPPMLVNLSFPHYLLAHGSTVQPNPAAAPTSTTPADPGMQGHATGSSMQGLLASLTAEQKAKMSQKVKQPDPTSFAQLMHGKEAWLGDWEDDDPDVVFPPPWLPSVNDPTPAPSMFTSQPWNSMSGPPALPLGAAWIAQPAGKDDAPPSSKLSATQHVWNVEPAYAGMPPLFGDSGLAHLSVHDQSSLPAHGLHSAPGNTSQQLQTHMSLLKEQQLELQKQQQAHHRNMQQQMQQALQQQQQSAQSAKLHTPQWSTVAGSAPWDTAWLHGLENFNDDDGFDDALDWEILEGCIPHPGLPTVLPPVPTQPPPPLPVQAPHQPTNSSAPLPDILLAPTTPPPQSTPGPSVTAEPSHHHRHHKRSDSMNSTGTVGKSGMAAYGKKMQAEDTLKHNPHATLGEWIAHKKQGPDTQPRKMLKQVVPTYTPAFNLSVAGIGDNLVPASNPVASQPAAPLVPEPVNLPEEQKVTQPSSNLRSLRSYKPAIPVVGLTGPSSSKGQQLAASGGPAADKPEGLAGYVPHHPHHAQLTQMQKLQQLQKAQQEKLKTKVTATQQLLVDHQQASAKHAAKMIQIKKQHKQLMQLQGPQSAQISLGIQDDEDDGVDVMNIIMKGQPKLPYKTQHPSAMNAKQNMAVSLQKMHMQQVSDQGTPSEGFRNAQKLCPKWPECANRGCNIVFQPSKSNKLRRTAYPVNEYRLGGVGGWGGVGGAVLLLNKYDRNKLAPVRRLIITYL